MVVHNSTCSSWIYSWLECKGSRGLVAQETQKEVIREQESRTFGTSMIRMQYDVRNNNPRIEAGDTRHNSICRYNFKI